jgi:hypothetical protein
MGSSLVQCSSAECLNKIKKPQKVLYVPFRNHRKLNIKNVNNWVIQNVWRDYSSYLFSIVKIGLQQFS